MNELITLIIYLAQKSKHIIKMLALHPFPFLSQSLRGHFCEDWTRRMRDVANCNVVCGVLFGDNVDYHSIAWIWNGNDPKHIVTFHESGALPFVFVIRQRCCWITTLCLPKPKCRVGVQVWWHTKMQARDGESCDRWKPTMRGQCLLCYSWKPTSWSVKTLSYNRLVPIFTGHVLGTIGESNTYLLLPPFTERFMSSWHDDLCH